MVGRATAPTDSVAGSPQWEPDAPAVVRMRCFLLRPDGTHVFPSCCLESRDWWLSSHAPFAVYLGCMAQWLPGFLPDRRDGGLSTVGVGQLGVCRDRLELAAVLLGNLLDVLAWGVVPGFLVALVFPAYQWSSPGRCSSWPKTHDPVVVSWGRGVLCFSIGFAGTARPAHLGDHITGMTSVLGSCCSNCSTWSVPERTCAGASGQ